MSDRAERLYEKARALPPESREAFIREACGEDPKLQDELLSLLEGAEAAEDFFGLLGDAVLSGSFNTGGEAPTDLASGERPSEASEPSPSPDLPAGYEVSHYRILERIASGGMGTVYRARDTQLGRDVALKFLPAYLGTDDEAAERLLAEARAAAALEHPNVCTVHEIGETEEGQSFIAMAFYEGETLKERLRQGTLPLEEAVEVTERVARGLAAAHARGIIHRDVKPGNVMLTTDGTVKLLDFGLAKVAGVTLTGPGTVQGTVPYMSPEQVRGEPLDPRTDLWSLGVMLYEMLAGARPFRGGNDLALLHAILHRDPEPVTKRRPGIPDPLARIVERLLRKEPDARYASTEELRADLARAISLADGTPRLAALLARRPTLAATGIGALMIALVAGALWFLGRGDEPASPVGLHAQEASIAVLPLADLGPDGGNASLARGMTEELIGMLTRSGDVRVIASTSVFAFDGSQLDVRGIADSLDVSNVLEGSLQKIGERLRVQVRLVDARDGSTRWSETYDRELKDLFAVQHEIARAVATELDLKLTGADTARPLSHETRNIAAYELYLRGSDQALLRSDSGVRRAVEYFEQATALDSTYAAAHAGLARMHLVLAGRADSERRRRELQELAEESSLTAVALDDSVAEAHAALAIVQWGMHYDFDFAERELRRAIDLDPSRALFRQWLAQLYLQMGRPRAALAPARRAVEIDPLSATAHAEMAHALLANGRSDEALARLERIADVQPPLLRVAPYKAQAYAMKGMWPEAIAALRSQAETTDDPTTLSLYSFLLARGGRRQEAMRVHETLLERWRRGESVAGGVAITYAGLGDLDRAFEWLERAIENRSLIRSNFHIMEPIYAQLHSDPRFERIRERLGLQKR